MTYNTQMIQSAIKSRQLITDIIGYLRPTAGLIAASIILGIGLVIGLIAAGQYNGSSIQQLVNASEYNQASSLQSKYDTADTKISNSFVSNIPLLILWAGVGLIAYWLGSTIVTVISRGHQLQEELSYVHAQPKALIQQALLKGLIRLVALIIWVLFIYTFVHMALPYIVAVVDASRGEALKAGVVYLVSAVALASTAWYINILFIRLFCLRSRLFG